MVFSSFQLMHLIAVAPGYGASRCPIDDNPIGEPLSITSRRTAILSDPARPPPYIHQVLQQHSIFGLCSLSVAEGTFSPQKNWSISSPIPRGCSLFQRVGVCAYQRPLAAAATMRSCSFHLHSKICSSVEPRVASSVSAIDGRGRPPRRRRSPHATQIRRGLRVSSANICESITQLVRSSWNTLLVLHSPAGNSTSA